jgi:hypothetical protein
MKKLISASSLLIAMTFSTPTLAGDSCPDLSGVWQRQEDGFTVFLETTEVKDVCKIVSTKADTGGFHHKLVGVWNSKKSWYRLTVSRKNKVDGCETEMYGRIKPSDDTENQFTFMIYGSDGNCDVPNNYKESNTFYKME